MRFARRKRIVKALALFLVLNIMTQVVFPTVSYALTSGPSQPEIQSFEPVGTTEMVDLFTGDFTYNIPLFEIPGPNGGYPFNLAYNAGITADQEASWVGLGWNVNPGAITRQMRGIPDEFNGAEIVTKTDMRPNVTFGLGVGGSLELFGGNLAEGVSSGKSVGLGMNVYYNNYRGMGLSFDPSLQLGGSGDGLTAGLGLSLSLDTQEGVGLDASLSLSDNGEHNDKTFKIGAGYNSHSGLKNISIGFDISASDNIRITGSKGKKVWNHDATKNATASIGGSSTLSFAGGGFSPSVTMPMEGRNASLQFRAGGELVGAFAHGYVTGFFNTQYLKDRNDDIKNKAYGYLNMQNAGLDAMLDFSREKDGVIRKNSPNLANPMMNCDVYTVAGQGVSGMYRPYRNDVGILFDQATESKIAGGAFGLEPGVGTGTHLGGDLSVNYSKSKSGKWVDNNEINGTYSFKGTQSGNGVYEPVYFKSHGEMTSDDPGELANVGGDDAVRINLERTQSTVDVITAKNALEKSNGTPVTPTSYVSSANELREPRNMLVQPVGEDYSLTNGLYTVKPDGTKYRYTLPAKNYKQVECQFTAGAQGTNVCAPTINIDKTSDGGIDYKKSNTDMYYSKKTIPTYAHSFLLTEILGPDYVDADHNNIPSDGDFGYWVRFEYTQTTSNYKWRAPFKQASYIKGLNTMFEDDKGAYAYGEKDMYYLSKVTTKSHVAIFRTSQRKDGRGVNDELQNANDKGAYSYKLDKIDLYVKEEFTANATTAKPIKSVNFQYTYDLCKNVPNNDHSNDVGTGGTIVNNWGKLTLTKVWFTYEKNMRGSLSPYVFEYNSVNPDYLEFGADRWGYYRTPSGDGCKDLENAYVNQFSSRTLLDANAAAWCLTDIKIPSGGRINVNYEADDYAYVQNKTAMQMTEISSLSPGNSSSGAISHPRWASDDRRKVYFNLEHPIPDNANATKEFEKYFDKTNKLYFKVFMDIRKSSDNRQDYVSGYVDILGKGLDGSSKSGTNFTKGYVTMGRPKIGDKSLPYHPFSVAAWQYIRSMNPNLNGIGPYTADPNTNKSAALDKIRSLVNIITEVKQIFQGFHSHCFTSNWGENIIIGKSYIRLNSPDKVKVGGGVRVKRITLSDGWNDQTSAEPDAVYGQVYDYSMPDEEGISSGVATYEPMLGSDETALRNVKEYPEKIAMKTNNNLFFEYPVNEGYYPAASVGYRRVMVKSLATHYSTTNVDDVPGGLNIPSGILTTGATVHEFYTAKDFPVITDETPIDIQTASLFIPIPLIGQTSNNHLTASQGYSILLNDMHGKPKKISNYKQDATGAMVEKPISWILYNYGVDDVNVLTEKMETPYHKLNNNVTTLVSDRDGSTTKAQRVLGQDFEFFTDMRQMVSNGEGGGIKINTDVIILGTITIPSVVPWPSFNHTNNEVYIAVTNKIIHRAGILKSTEAFTSEGSHIVTTNILFDNLTGQPLLTTVTNDFNDPIFNYDIPGHFNYDELGPAYKSVGISFSGTISSAGIVSGIDPVVHAHLASGDILLTNGGGTVLNKKLSGNRLEISNTGLTGTQTFKVISSGRRNMIINVSGNIKTLGSKVDPIIGDPTVNTNRF